MGLKKKVVLNHLSWSVAELDQPQTRLRLARFWLAAPEDQLEVLWQGAIGEATRQSIRAFEVTTVLPPDQIELRDQLNARLDQGLTGAGLIQIWMATFVFSPPGLFKIESAERYLPSWLVGDYHSLYSQATGGTIAQPKPFLSQGDQKPSVAQSSTSSNRLDGQLPEPEFGPFPSTLHELKENRLHLNRLLGLSNLYYIDPEDQEILKDLQQVRRSLAISIQSCPESELEAIWASDVGDRYWALVRSGLQKEALSKEDEAIKQQVTHALTPSLGGGFGQPGSINAFLVSLLYFLPGSMKVEGAEQKIPTWLMPSYQEIFANALEA